MDYMFHNSISKGKGPKRLFIGGLHGKEGITTKKILSQIPEEKVKGSLIIYNFDISPYISTLDPQYYETTTGKKIIELINQIKPDFYLELHCYNPENYHHLTSLNRKEEDGVPPLIELAEGVLISSISPHIRKQLFTRENVCITLEIPCNFSNDSLNVYMDILEHIINSKDRAELEERIGKKYPLQVEKAYKYAKEVFGDFPAF